MIAPRSTLPGKTLRELRFRSRFAVHVIAVHRNAKNLLDQFLDLPLHVGDTLLMVGTDASLHRLRSAGDVVLADRPLGLAPLAEMTPVPRWHKWAVWSTLVAVVGLPTAGVMPIATAALCGCVELGLLGVAQTGPALRAIDWSVMLTIYGMLALGIAVEKTGLDEVVARALIAWAGGAVGPALVPHTLLALFTLTTIALTEVISNNAAAAVVAPLAIGTAVALGVSPQPFLIAVTMGASLAFAVPMGYQTHLMVYGAGGYKVTDFLRLGLPLDFIVWAMVSLFTPIIWPFAA